MGLAPKNGAWTTVKDQIDDQHRVHCTDDMNLLTDDQE